MNIQSETVRKYVLNRLEDGSFTSGMRLPGSRKISEELNISRPVVQSALDTLVNEGILKAAQRSGLYVEPEWRQRQIRSSLLVFKSEKPLPWLELFRSELGGQLPELHISTQFRRCPLEIITTAGAQSRHDEFIDLMPILRECYPDLTPFYAEQLHPFTWNGRLTALPFVFSPRLIAISRKMLREAGCAEPSSGWVIADLMNLLAGLRRKFAPERIFSSHTVRTFWLNFVLSCGGSLFDPENCAAVQFDSEEALDGFRAARALRGPGEVREIPPQECAVMIVDRQTYRRIQDGMSDEWLFLPIPGNVPGRNVIALATMTAGSAIRYAPPKERWVSEPSAAGSVRLWAGSTRLRMSKMVMAEEKLVCTVPPARRISKARRTVVCMLPVIRCVPISRRCRC